VGVAYSLLSAGDNGNARPFYCCVSNDQVFWFSFPLQFRLRSIEKEVAGLVFRRLGFPRTLRGKHATFLAFRFRGSANWPGVVRWTALGQIKSTIGFENPILSTTIRPSNHIRVLHSRKPSANTTGASSPASPQRERSSPQLLAPPSFS